MSFYKHSTAGTLLKLYSSFIHPHLEYAIAVWDPFLEKDVELLEDIQKFGLRMRTKIWSSDIGELVVQSYLPT